MKNALIDTFRKITFSELLDFIKEKDFNEIEISGESYDTNILKKGDNLSLYQEGNDVVFYNKDNEYSWIFSLTGKVEIFKNYFIIKSEDDGTKHVVKFFKREQIVIN